MAANSTTIGNSEVKYDRTTRDYVVLVDGRPVAYASTYSQAEQKRTQFLADRAAA